MGFITKMLILSHSNSLVVCCVGRVSNEGLVLIGCLKIKWFTKSVSCEFLDKLLVTSSRTTYHAAQLKLISQSVSWSDEVKFP